MTILIQNIKIKIKTKTLTKPIIKSSRKKQKFYEECSKEKIEVNEETY